MSAYIVDNKTISAIVKGIEQYNVDYRAENYTAPVQIIINLQQMRNAIGQSLLDQNYKSVNYRYGEDTITPKFTFEDEKNTVAFNDGIPGIILGCIKCYNYQTCETSDYFTSDLYYSLQELKTAMLERYIANEGFDIPWGYEV